MKNHSNIEPTGSDKELYGGDKEQGTIPPDIEKPEKQSPHYEEDDNTEVDPTKHPPERQLNPPKKTVQTPTAQPTPDATPETDNGSDKTDSQPGNV